MFYSCGDDACCTAFSHTSITWPVSISFGNLLSSKYFVSTLENSLRLSTNLQEYTNNRYNKFPSLVHLYMTETNYKQPIVRVRAVLIWLLTNAWTMNSEITDNPCNTNHELHDAGMRPSVYIDTMELTNSAIHVYSFCVLSLPEQLAKSIQIFVNTMDSLIPPLRLLNRSIPNVYLYKLV